jgi:hypothetical protein
MTTDLKKRLLNFLERTRTLSTVSTVKDKLNYLKELDSLIKEMKTSLKYYEITSICKDDFEEFIKDENFTKKEINSLKDYEMERIASKMADAYLEYSYWDDLKYFTEYTLEKK